MVAGHGVAHGVADVLRSARGLGRIGNPRAKNPLQKLLQKEKYARVRKAAEKAIKSIDESALTGGIDMTGALDSFDLDP